MSGSENILCPTGLRTFNFNGTLPAGSTLQWEVTGPIQKVQESNTSVTVKAVGNQGTATVTSVVSNSCGADTRNSKQFEVISPTYIRLSFGPFNGSNQVSYNTNIVCARGYSIYASLDNGLPLPAGTHFQWTVSGYGYTWGASGNFLDIAFSNPAFATINVTVVGNSDPCLSQLYANHTFQVSSNCGNAPAPISQNTTDLKITVPNSANERNGEKDVINL